MYVIHHSLSELEIQSQVFPVTNCSIKGGGRGVLTGCGTQKGLRGPGGTGRGTRGRQLPRRDKRRKS